MSDDTPWKDEIDAALVIRHLGTADSFASPKAAIDALLEWEASVAVYFHETQEQKG